ATVPLDEYRSAWREAVRVFGRNQVSTYLLVGMGEDPDEMVAGAKELIAMGVYPFVVPFRPLKGTLATDVDKVGSPSTNVVQKITAEVAKALSAANMHGSDQAAGCAACGACSMLQAAGA
ncbi:MAG TPA: radical SAM protein, partial [Arthrobacter sp.]|nr:radical SAM protein [Arthrobacter sp.]